MKNLFITLAACTMLLCTTACSDEATPLTASKAKSALKEEAVFAKDAQVANFTTGYYEVTRDQLQNLAALKAAGVIEYTAEKVIETTYKRVGWYSTIREVRVPHVFVRVSLTPAGEKYVVENPITQSDRRKDPNEGYEAKLPDYTNAVDNLFDTVEASDEPVDDEFYEEPVQAVNTPSPAANNSSKQPSEPKADPNAAYKACQSRVSTDEVKVLLGHFEIDKIRDIRCTEDMLKNGTATCKVYAKFTDMTPFGYVLSNWKPDYIYTISASFEYYQDGGWVVSKLD